MGESFAILDMRDICMLPTWMVILRMVMEGGYLCGILRKETPFTSYIWSPNCKVEGDLLGQGILQAAINFIFGSDRINMVKMHYSYLASTPSKSSYFGISDFSSSKDFTDFCHRFKKVR